MIPVDLIHKDVITCKIDDSILAVTKIMAEHSIGSIIVVEDNKPVGIFTERDLLIRVVAAEKALDTTIVKDVMTADLIVATKGDSCASTYMKMKEKNIRHIPVIDAHGALIGIISISDVIFRMNDLLLKQSASTEYFSGIY